MFLAGLYEHTVYIGLFGLYSNNTFCELFGFTEGVVRLSQHNAMSLHLKSNHRPDVESVSQGAEVFINSL